MTTSTVAAGTVGLPYSASLQAISGTAPYAWSVASGVLPAGLTLSSTGVISGTPTAAGSATFTVKALDSSVPTAQQATRSLTLTINPAPAASLWVGNNANSNINAFPLSANGNVAPARTLGGPLTGLNGIGGLAFDGLGELYVAGASSNAIALFAAGASGNVAPVRVLQGPATGNAIPLATIGGPSTQLNFPTGLARDAAGDLFVANLFGSSVLRFAGTSLNGNVVPNLTIAGASAQLGLPESVDLDAGQRVYVADENTGVTVYAPGTTPWRRSRGRRPASGGLAAWPSPRR